MWKAERVSMHYVLLIVLIPIAIIGNSFIMVYTLFEISSIHLDTFRR